MVSAVAGELSQRLLTGSSNGTKKRKREDDEDKVIDQQTTICPVTSEVSTSLSGNQHVKNSHKCLWHKERPSKPLLLSVCHCSW